MKTNTILSIVIFSAISLSLTSCSKDFFDLQPNYEVAVDKVYSTESDFELAINGCYAKLQSQTSFYIECCEYRSDNLYLNAPTSGTQDRYDIDHFKDTPSNGILETYWASFYNEIYRCNMVLDRIDNASFNEEKKKQYKGEALFLRAYTYFNLYRTWGGVQVTDKVVSVNQALNIKKSSDSEMYNIIAGDLEMIVNGNLLPASFSGNEIGRATIGAAKALLGKVYLTFGQFQKAADILGGIIGTYELLPDIADVFSVSNKMNKEIIFAVRFNKNIVDEGHGAWFSITNLTDDSNQSEILKNLYTSDDKRKPMIEYVKVPNVSVCLMRKFYDTIDASTSQYGNDQIILRYPDVLLMYAEALNELGYSASQNSPALEALNAVRKRAGINDLDIANIPDQAAFRKAIALERQKEFPYEGQRWFDEVRLGVAIDAAAAEGNKIQVHQYLYPIPTTELERINNSDLLWQNPGY